MTSIQYFNKINHNLELVRWLDYANDTSESKSPTLGDRYSEALFRMTTDGHYSFMQDMETEEQPKEMKIFMELGFIKVLHYDDDHWQCSLTNLGKVYVNYAFKSHLHTEAVHKPDSSAEEPQPINENMLNNQHQIVANQHMSNSHNISQSKLTKYFTIVETILLFAMFAFGFGGFTAMTITFGVTDMLTMICEAIVKSATDAPKHVKLEANTDDKTQFNESYMDDIEGSQSDDMDVGMLPDVQHQIDHDMEYGHDIHSDNYYHWNFNKDNQNTKLDFIIFVLKYHIVPSRIYGKAVEHLINTMNYDMFASKNDTHQIQPRMPFDPLAIDPSDIAAVARHNPYANNPYTNNPYGYNPDDDNLGSDNSDNEPWYHEPDHDPWSDDSDSDDPLSDSDSDDSFDSDSDSDMFPPFPPIPPFL